MFDKVYKRVNTVVAMDSEVMEGSKKTQVEVTEDNSKRAGDEIEQKSAKRQRLEKENDSAKLKRCLEIVPEDDDDVTIKATPLSSKSPIIVDYKIYKERKKRKSCYPPYSIYKPINSPALLLTSLNMFFQIWGCYMLYVDDMLIAAKNMAVINDLKALLKRRLWVSQEKYIEKVLHAFFVDQSKPVSTPLAAHFKLDRSIIPGTDKEVKYMKTVPYSSAVGSPMYARVCMRPDLAHAVSVVSRFMANPGKAHWKAVKWILRYLKGASNICLVYDGKGHGDGLVGYADSNYDGDLVKRKSLTCFIFTLYGCAVSWKSTLQPAVALSTTKAEYMSMTEGIKDQSALSLAKNLVYHKRTKHIDVRLNFIRDVLEEDRKETTKRDNEEPLTVGEIPSQGGDCCLSVRKVLVTWHMQRSQEKSIPLKTQDNQQMNERANDEFVDVNTTGGVKLITNKVSSNEASTSEGDNTVNTTNSFDALSKQDVDYNDTAHEDIVPKASTKMVDTRKYVERVDDDSESDVEEVQDETTSFMESNVLKLLIWNRIRVEVEVGIRVYMNVERIHLTKILTI
nr:retrovirus-related Pol polyprotein from transposon TNT 1-94 [Tanacetum cinerariifolium]